MNTQNRVGAVVARLGRNRKMELVHKLTYISDVRALLNSDVNLHRPCQHPCDN